MILAHAVAAMSSHWCPVRSSRSWWSPS